MSRRANPDYMKRRCNFRDDDEAQAIDVLIELESRWEQLQIKDELHQFDSLANRIRSEEK